MVDAFLWLKPCQIHDFWCLNPAFFMVKAPLGGPAGPFLGPEVQEVARNALRGIRQSMLTDQKGVGWVQIWKTIGKPLENHWKLCQNHWKTIVNHGTLLENHWKALENHWKIIGKSL
jgi:hypothetical protein